MTLDMSSEASFCNACVKAKPMHKPVPKECTSPHATNVGNKVHSDVWGPATPQVMMVRNTLLVSPMTTAVGAISN